METFYGTQRLPYRMAELSFMCLTLICSCLSYTEVQSTVLRRANAHLDLAIVLTKCAVNEMAGY